MNAAKGRMYQVTAATNGDGTSTILTKSRTVDFDSSPTQGDELPGPADLLTSALAACVLKNVERLGDTLKFDWTAARIAVEAERQDAPPKITRIHHRLEIDTTEPDHRVELLHRNITKFGTIYNALAAACDVTGEIVAVRTPNSRPERQELRAADATTATGIDGLDVSSTSTEPSPQ
jgi:uncharacterized OsmC-like protein